jgi:septal ring factor EnvC (AmiA/AmiB activator)
MEINKTKIENIKNETLSKVKGVLKSDPVVKILGKAGEQLIVAGTLGVVLYFILNSLFDATRAEWRQTNKNVKEIQAKVNVINDDQNEIKSKIQTFEENQSVFLDMIKHNNDLLEQNNRDLRTLKKAYSEKINTVGNYNYKQLDSFFAARYKQHQGQ